MSEEMGKLEYIYQHFQDHKKINETDPQVTSEQINDTLYPQINNDIEYGLFKNVIDSYYLDSQISDDFQCTKKLVTHMTPQPVHCIQTHPVDTHMIIFHNSTP